MRQASAGGAGSVLLRRRRSPGLGSGYGVKARGLSRRLGFSAFPPFRPSVHELPFPRST